MPSHWYILIRLSVHNKWLMYLIPVLYNCCLFAGNCHLKPTAYQSNVPGAVAVMVALLPAQIVAALAKGVAGVGVTDAVAVALALVQPERLACA
jgi:hypothetical protein